MHKRIFLFVMLAILACSSQVRTPDATAPKPQPQKPRIVGEVHGQIVIYTRPVSPVPHPIRWEIRKVSLTRTDGSQFDIRGSASDITLNATRKEQRLITISEASSGDYAGLTVFTRGVYFSDTGQTVPVDLAVSSLDHRFSVNSGDAKTLIILLDIQDGGEGRQGFRFDPVLSVEDEDPNPSGKLIYVANELSSNISVINKDLGHVIYNIFTGTAPYALGADNRRDRLYISDRKDGVIYEMDMTGNHLTRANEIEFVDEPVHIEPLPVKDSFIVVNYGTNSIYVVDAFTFQIVETVEVGEDPVDAVYSAYRDLAFVANEAFGTISVLDMSKSPVEVDTTLQVELEPAGLVIYDADDYVFVSNSGSADLSIIDLETMAIERTITVGVGAGDIAFDPFGRRLYVSMGRSSEILCVDPFTGVVTYTIGLPAHPGRILFDSDDKKLYVTVPDLNAVAVVDPLIRAVAYWIDTGYRPMSLAARL
jgi:YVTN family beta-propeller protein